MSVLVLVTLMKLFAGWWNTPPVSLGELARREAVRRQAMPASVMAITNSDLAPAPLGMAAGKRTRAPEAGAGDKRDQPADRPATRDEAWWRARMVGALAAVDRDRVLAAALESRIAALTRDVANRDDPIQRAALVADRVRAVEELTSMRAQLEEDTRAVADLEDEARREGVPPGWLRGGGR